tara:strand:- start:1389 stop:2231 length:843 start_codon:yes stop_codon:yes gene_type:complete
MYSEKYLLFTTGNGTADPLNWDSREAALYNVKDFEGTKITSARTIDLYFNTIKGREIVTLNVKNGTQISIITAIGNALINNKQSVIPVADVDNNSFIHNAIYGVTIKGYSIYPQSISGTSKTKINLGYSPSSITLSATTASVIDLWVTSITGEYITDTGTDANESDNVATESGVVLTVDGTAATSDTFEDERVWKSDGTLYGICSSRDLNTQITFATGLEQTLANNDSLYTGSRFYILKSVTIPSGSTLKLDSDEISFSLAEYIMYAKLTSGTVDLIARS